MGKNAERLPILLGLSAYLNSLQGEWLAQLDLGFLVKKQKVLWPDDEPGRASAWMLLERLLLSSVDGGFVNIWTGVRPHRKMASIAWPASDGSPTDRVEAKVTQVARTQPDGGKVNVPLPGGLAMQTVQIASLESLARPPRKASEGCARSVLQLLYESQKRHTGEDLALALQNGEGYYPWSQTVIDATCAWLRRQGVVDNQRDGYGSGYGLLDWSVNPDGGN